MVALDSKKKHDVKREHNAIIERVVQKLAHLEQRTQAVLAALKNVWFGFIKKKYLSSRPCLGLRSFPRCRVPVYYKHLVREQR
jgi:hypothetical protein